ncbi:MULTISPECIES: methyltransferase domain-containing protein [unclassified Agromyces]|uniref:methyltransferase domain-containing protein n=1 Tax=unclassified Agromyces TaxID=2639701 RepID=UPI003015131B
MSIDSTWLRCPNCMEPLSTVDVRVLGCAEGHRFDASKYGTLTLLPPRAPHTVGDSRDMLEARSRLLGSGVYDPIVRAVGDAAATGRSPASDHDDDSGALRIVDLGCGTGYYAAGLARRFAPAALLLVDRSPAAVRMAVRTLPGATGVVVDLWRPLPIRDDAADLAINVFAPRNAAEFARILRRDGLLVIVVPTDRHLAELRSLGGLLDIPTGKAEQVTAQFAGAGFAAVSRTPVEYPVSLDADQVRATMDMGPSAHHRADLDHAKGDVGLDVTVSVDVLLFRRN